MYPPSHAIEMRCVFSPPSPSYTASNVTHPSATSTSLATTSGFSLRHPHASHRHSPICAYCLTSYDSSRPHEGHFDSIGTRSVSSPILPSTPNETFLWFASRLSITMRATSGSSALWMMTVFGDFDSPSAIASCTRSISPLRSSWSRNRLSRTTQSGLTAGTMKRLNSSSHSKTPICGRLVMARADTMPPVMFEPLRLHVTYIPARSMTSAIMLLVVVLPFVPMTHTDLCSLDAA